MGLGVGCPYQPPDDQKSRNLATLQKTAASTLRKLSSVLERGKVQHECGQDMSRCEKGSRYSEAECSRALGLELGVRLALNPKP